MILTEEEKDSHIIEAVGRSRIVIRDGKVTEVSESRIRECPLAKRFAYPVGEISPGEVKANIEHRMGSFGMCRPDRKVCGRVDFVGFGASELISAGILSGFLDAAVLACDGAGTVVVWNPELVQGVGGRMSGLVQTSPFQEAMDRIEAQGGMILDKGTARIDQAAGVALAIQSGRPRVAVTVALAEDAVRIRECHPDALIIGVHLTATSQEDAERLVSVADIVTGCASRWIWELGGARATLQAGTAVPVFALTPRGKKLILLKIERMDRPVLVSGGKLPVYGPETPRP